MTGEPGYELGCGKLNWRFPSRDRIVAVNGQPLRDVIDFHFHGGEERLRLDVERGDEATAVTLRRRGPDLGLELLPPRPAEIST